MSTLLRVPTVAAVLDTTEEHVYRLLRRGDLPRVRVGRAVRVDAAELERWISRGGAPEAE